MIAHNPLFAKNPHLQQQMALMMPYYIQQVGHYMHCFKYHLWLFVIVVKALHFTFRCLEQVVFDCDIIGCCSDM